jgi:NADPH-dependent ferric siderophore reductase
MDAREGGDVSFQDARRGRGVYQAQVKARAQVGPHVVRVTAAGESLGRLPRRGFDHWFRLFLPADGDDAALALVPDRLTSGVYLKFVASGAAKRLTVRNYTIRNHRPEAAEIDIDFAVHQGGVASEWAQGARPGDRLALLDQGCGFDLPPDADNLVLVGDQTAQSAVLGIYRDLPSQVSGLAVIEAEAPADAQTQVTSSGVELRYVYRNPGQAPGAAALEEVRALHLERPGAAAAYIAGERDLVSAARRHLLQAGVPKPRIAFMTYWRAR